MVPPSPPHMLMGNESLTLPPATIAKEFSNEVGYGRLLDSRVAVAHGEIIIQHLAARGWR